METLYLSRRNIAALLSKLDRARSGESSACTIIKNDNAHPVYPQTLRRVAVTAVEARDHYFRAVSQRLNLSRPTLLFLLAQLEKQPEATIELEDMRVIAVVDEKYYGDHALQNSTPVGHVSSALLKFWLKIR